MNGQLEFEIIESKITKLGFLKCKDCDWEPVCPHAGYRAGCRTKEKLMEVKYNGMQI